MFIYKNTSKQLKYIKSHHITILIKVLISVFVKIVIFKHKLI